MGKAKKIKSGKSKRNVPLEKQIEDDKFAKPSTRVKVRQRNDEDAEFVDSNLSQRILEQARLQQDEIEDDMGPSARKPPAAPRLGAGSDESDGEETDSMAGDFYEKISDFSAQIALHTLNLLSFHQSVFTENYQGFTLSFEDTEVDEEDERALEMFMSANPAPRRTLADIIMEKVTEKQTELQTQCSDAGSLQVQELDPRVRQMYEGVRDVLAKYRSGKLPKAFKIVPSLRNWEQILYVTDPGRWSAAAMYQATRIFTSNLSEKMAQRFFNLVLLPRVRDDIAEFKRLNFHLYQALRKALFKPGAFMKGLLLPLCESGTCTLREAIIIGSVVARNSIPVLHSSAALLKIAEMDYNGANSVFLRIFFDKKYALPYRVVDAVVFHFLRFERDRRELPVLWHQALLTFVQRYKGDISSEQRELLLGLLRHQSHATITPEVRRELQHARCRDVEVPPVCS